MLTNIYKLYKDILWLKISMENSLSVHVLDAFASLSDDCLGLVFTKSLLLFQDSKKMSINGILQKHIEVKLVVEKSVQTDNLWMIQIELYFQLSDELVIDLLIDKGLFLNDLQCANESCFDVLDKIDISKLSLTQLFAKFKV